MRLNTKVFFSGIVFGFLIMCGCAAYAAGGLRYAVFSGTKIIYDGRVLNLGGKRLLSAAKENERYSQTYMPTRAVFEAMGFDVDWNAESKTVVVTGEPGGTDYSGLYWTPETQSEPIEDEFYMPSYETRNPITVPSGLSERERISYNLMADIMTAEMDTDSGLASIISVADNAESGSVDAQKQLSDALYDALSAGVAEGSKRVLSIIDKPTASSTAAYTSAYNLFSDYTGQLDKMLQSLKSVKLEEALAHFGNAYDIYMNF